MDTRSALLLLKQRRGRLAVAAIGVTFLTIWPLPATGDAQQRITSVKSLRCTFPLSAVGTWKNDGPPDAAVKPAALILIFDSIDPDGGTARSRSGTAGSDVIARLSGRYLHLMQSFRTGPLYTTTVFDNDTGPPFKAVHSRHEYFTVPLPGATSSPEQYYGTCVVPN